MKKITIFSKCTIVTIDLILLSIIWFLVSESLGIGIGSELEEKHGRFLWFFSYSLYFVLPEYYYKKTLAMKIYGVKIQEEQISGFKERAKYAVLALIDRTIYFIVNIIYGILGQNEYKLFLSEKYSGFLLVRSKINTK